MSPNVLCWAGVLLAAGAAIGMRLYLLSIGDGPADPRVSALGAVVGLAGLALAGRRHQDGS
ncbi:hypothetical protein ACIBHX_20255 [Nonomuraea sp. NPDC050536]|uniref:hypothetical protein n=1 Tax=Nonomuraea sp. NPDC050536 TaxID=3364366 RepID=UPI0037C8F1EB